MAYKLTTDKTWAQIDADVREQLSRWGAATYSLSRPNASTETKQVKATAMFQTPEQALVVVQADWKSGRQLRLSYNKQARAVDNARVLFLAIESLRLNEVRGIDDVLREAYLQLPAPENAVRLRTPYEVLGIGEGTSIDVIKLVFRTKAKALHPDTGGETADPEAMKELQEAYELLVGAQ